MGGKGERAGACRRLWRLDPCSNPIYVSHKRVRTIAGDPRSAYGAREPVTCRPQPPEVPREPPRADHALLCTLLEAPSEALVSGKGERAGACRRLWRLDPCSNPIYVSYKRVRTIAGDPRGAYGAREPVTCRPQPPEVPREPPSRPLYHTISKINGFGT